MKIIKSKTFWVTILGIVVSFITFLTGEIEFEIFLATVGGAIAVVFARLNVGMNLKTILNGYFQKVEWLKDGTFWIMIVGVIGSVSAWLTDTIGFLAMATTVFTTVIMFFFRGASVPE